jgi:MoxR-like ATPase
MTAYGTYTGRGTDFYETNEAVAETINLAIQLERPLLVEGEAGCGKTLLARSISVELGLGEPIAIRIKSTTEARDLLYRFDALRRLQEVQNPRFEEHAAFVYPYISLQPLGLAIQVGRPSVVLIDEIDKADIDFPNDLLDVLDEFAFDIEDLPEAESGRAEERWGFGRHVRSDTGVRPIVVITSNREKQLPEPFLRRCLYLQLEFPDDEALLASIVRKNLSLDPRSLSEELIRAAVGKFLEVRKKAQAVGADQKLPATSELIDWIKILTWKGHTPGTVGSSDLQPPYVELLFKTAADLRAYRAQKT